VTQSTLQPPADPSLDDWCTSSRLDLLFEELQSAREVLLWSGQFELVLRGWIRRQLFDEAVRNEWFVLSNQPEEDQSCLPGFSQELHQRFKYKDQGLLAWAEHHWGHSLETLYLSQKSKLDRITLRMLRVSDAGLALELYHRIKAGEASFAQMSWEFGEGDERFQAGLIKNERLDRLPGPLIPLLNNLQSDSLQRPRRFGNQYVLYQLVKRQPLVFDHHTRQLLLLEQLKCWEVPLLDRLAAHLASDN